MTHNKAIATRLTGDLPIAVKVSRMNRS